MKLKHTIPVVIAGLLVALGGLITDHSKLYPNTKLTPGAMATQWTIQDICQNGTGKYRKVPESLKKEVAKEYGLTYPQPTGKIEIDHWYPLGIGGSNDIANLWAMPAPQFHEKDVVEAYLNKQVCAQKMTVYDAQKIINNWYPFWQKNFKDKVGAVVEEPVE